MQRIKKGDKVRVISGSEKGLEGVVVKVYPKKNLAEVEGVNIRKKHQKPNQEKQEGGIVEITLPVNMSKLSLIDTKAKNQNTRIKFGYDKENKKVRIAKRSNHILATK